LIKSQVIVYLFRKIKALNFGRLDLLFISKFGLLLAACPSSRPQTMMAHCSPVTEQRKKLINVEISDSNLACT
jgi:hypothetical protein